MAYRPLLATNPKTHFAHAQLAKEASGNYGVRSKPILISKGVDSPRDREVPECLDLGF